MNQTTNLIQWKNLTDEQKAGFDFEGYDYEMQCDLKWFDIRDFEGDEVVYRLRIEPDKWYFCEVKTIPNNRTENTIKLGEHLTLDFIEACHIVRPATADEIPKPEVLTLEDRVKFEYSGFDVVMLEWIKNNPVDILKIYSLGHFAAQSMRGFAGYVYGEDGGFTGFYTSIKPIDINDNGIVQPIAVLFTRAGE